MKTTYFINKRYVVSMDVIEESENSCSLVIYTLDGKKMEFNADRSSIRKMVNDIRTDTVYKFAVITEEK